MRLHSREFEKKLRRRVKQTVRESASLTKEYRRTKIPWWRRKLRINLWFLGLILMLPVGLIVYLVELSFHDLWLLLCLTAIWAFASAVFLAQRLMKMLTDDRDVAALYFLPVTEETIFSWQQQKFFRRSLLFLFQLVSAFVVLAFLRKFSMSQWLGTMPIAGLIWLTMTGLAALIFTYVPRRIHIVLNAAIVLAMVIGIFLAQFVWVPLLRLIVIHSQEIILLLPTGWPLSLFHLVLEDGRWGTLVTLLPMALIIGSLPLCLNRLRDNFKFAEFIMPEAQDIEPAADQEDSALAVNETGGKRLGITAIEEIVLTRQFLDQPMRAGWLNGRLWSWLNVREQALLGFVFPKGFDVWPSWRITYRNLIAALAAVILAQYFHRKWSPSVFTLGLMVTVPTALLPILNTGTAFRMILCGGVRTPIYAVFGIGYRELGHMLMKTSAIQLPLFIPFALVWGLAGAWVFNFPWLLLLVISFKASGLIWAGRFIIILTRVSGGSNDTARLRWSSLVIVLTVLPAVFALLGLGAAALFAPLPAVAWGMWALTLVSVYLVFRLYGWFYNMNWFDLVSEPRANG